MANHCTKFKVFSFCCSRDIVRGTKNLNTLCLKKTTLMLHAITSLHITRFWYFLAEILLNEYAIKW